MNKTILCFVFATFVANAPSAFAAVERFQIHGHSCTPKTGVAPYYGTFGVGGASAPTVVNCPVMVRYGRLVRASLRIVGYNPAGPREVGCRLVGTEYAGSRVINGWAFLGYDPYAHGVTLSREVTLKPADGYGGLSSYLFVDCTLPAHGQAWITALFLDLEYA
jgi:hypothetical protein